MQNDREGFLACLWLAKQPRFVGVNNVSPLDVNSSEDEQSAADSNASNPTTIFHAQNKNEHKQGISEFDNIAQAIELFHKS